MIVAPRARLTARILSTDALFLPLALAYAFLLMHSWQTDTLKLILPGSLQEGLSGMPHGMINTQYNNKLIHIIAAPDVYARAFDKTVCAALP
jgi:hypothetical protein